MVLTGSKTKLAPPRVKEVFVRDTGTGFVVTPGRIHARDGDQIQIINETDFYWEVQVPAKHGLNGDYDAIDPEHYYVIDVDAATPRGDFPYQVYVEDEERGRRDYGHGNSAPHVIIL
jgi:hypothetical protein